MNKLPIALCLFTSTKGHFNASTYNDTLIHLNRQIPLSQFGGLYTHLKISTNQIEVGDEMEKNLVNWGFTVEKTVEDWSRGSSHQGAYLRDQRKASQSHVIQSQPFILLAEDDSTLSPVKADLLTCLSRMVGMLEKNPNLVSTRFVRRNDWDGGVPVLATEGDYWFSPNYDLQPSILRSRDFLIVHKIIEDNWEKLQHLQCELVLRIAMDTLSRAQNRHMVWHPDYAHSVHLGVPNYLEVKKELGL